VLIGAVACVIAFVVFQWMGFGLDIRLVAAWDAAVLTACLFLLFRLILRIQMPSSIERTRDRVSREGLVWMILGVVVVLLSVVVLVLTFLFLRRPEEHVLKEGQVWLPVVLGLIAVVGAWASMHLAFALHYARLHYRDSGNPNTLSFPNKAEMEPTDLDFAYFAFMIGMAFSGADVTVRGRSLRGWVLIHAVVSFVFNTAILALAINLAFDLL
jgi:uncharacterized membrane protein